MFFFRDDLTQYLWKVLESQRLLLNGDLSFPYLFLHCWNKSLRIYWPQANTVHINFSHGQKTDQMEQKYYNHGEKLEGLPSW